MVKAQIVAYYELDVSRVCPGKKYTVSVRFTSGEKERKQKRLVLANLKELYADLIDLTDCLKDLCSLDIEE